MSPAATLRCLCGGVAYTLDDLIDMSEPDVEHIGWSRMWRSMVGPFDLYCYEEDEVLTDMEVWGVYGLRVPCHDPEEGDPIEGWLW